MAAEGGLRLYVDYLARAGDTGLANFRHERRCIRSASKTLDLEIPRTSSIGLPLSRAYASAFSNRKRRAKPKEGGRPGAGQVEQFD